MAMKKAASRKKYSAKASKSVAREMKAFKEGTLKSSSGETVKNPKQAVAIGLSEARSEGAKVPPAPKKAAKKKSAKKTPAKKSLSKKS